LTSGSRSGFAVSAVQVIRTAPDGVPVCGSVTGVLMVGPGAIAALPGSFGDLSWYPGITAYELRAASPPTPESLWATEAARGTPPDRYPQQTAN